MTGGVTVTGRAAKSGAERTREWRARRRAAIEGELLMRRPQAERVAGALQAGLPLAPLLELAPPSAQGARGRSPAAIAKRTQQLRDLVLARYQSPIMAMMETGMRPVHLLATELQCTLLEAAELQRKCLAEAASYLHSKMPTAVQLEGAPMAPVIIGIGAATIGAPGGALPNEIKGLPVPAFAQSDNAQSDNGGQAIDRE